MPHTRRTQLQLTISALAFVAVSACAVDRTPTAPSATAAAERLSGSAVSQSNSQNGLEAELKAEESRLATDEAAARATYETLHEQWEAQKSAAEAMRTNGRAKVDLPLCEPLQFDGEARIIGPDGGEIQMGPHRLVIPKGALDRNVVISGEMRPSIVADVEFRPHGLRFNRSPVLTLDYHHCATATSGGHFVVYMNDQGAVLELPPSLDSKSDERVQGWLDHFSRYALAY